MPLRARASKKPKGAVVRKDTPLRRAAMAYERAQVRLSEYESEIAAQIMTLTALQEELATAETECVIEAEKHLTKKKSVVVGRVQFSRSTKNARVVDSVKLLGLLPKLHKVDGLFKVVLGVYDKTVASGAFNADKLGRPLSTETSFKYHVQLLEE